METVAWTVGIFYGLGTLAVIGLLAYFLTKRLEARKKEKFEKRDF